MSQPAAYSAIETMGFDRSWSNTTSRMPAMRPPQKMGEFAWLWRKGNDSVMPALRLGDQEVAEHLDARERLQFLRINEIGIHRDGVGGSEQLHQAAILLDQIIGQHGDAEPALAGA